MNRNEAIEQAAQAVVNWNSDSSVNSAVVMDALREALAMPKDAERVTYTGVGTVSNVLYNGGVVVEWHTNQRTLCGKTLYIKSDDQKADAERAALLERVNTRIDFWTEGLPTTSPTVDLLRDIRAYLGGDA
jgi:hypothetical protein